MFSNNFDLFASASNMIWYVDRHCNRAVILQYPDAWGATPETDFWFDDNYIGDRARLVHEIVRPQKP